jgi:hypothetical protein
MTQVRWPFGLADVSNALSATGAQAISIENDMTILDGVTTQATGNRTINLTIGADIKAGARILVKSKTNGTETTIFGTGCLAPTITGVAGKTKTCELVYDGTNFLATGTAVQLD